MRSILVCSTVAFLLFCLSCTDKREKTITGGPAWQDWEPISFEELTKDTIPPCLHYSGSKFQVVLRNHDDYETIRRIYAPQGEYEAFQADGVQKSFQLSYQPLDTDGNGVIGPHDLIIYVKYKPLYANVDGELIVVSSNPIRMDGDSILIFMTSAPYTVERKIYYETVFSVHPVTGEVTFTMAPQEGSRISLCARHKLYDTYCGRECSMQYFDFDSSLIIGKSFVGGGCLRDFEIRAFLDHDHRQLIYYWRQVMIDPSAGCPDIGVQVTHWISIEKPPDDYEIIFIEDSAFILTDE